MDSTQHVAQAKAQLDAVDLDQHPSASEVFIQLAIAHALTAVADELVHGRLYVVPER